MSVIIFILVMIVIISEKVHRAVCAVAGAVLLIIFGILDIETVYPISITIPSGC